ncbi:MAG: hypothetical protein RJA90_1116, partial [Bacteroidota bacterium]
VAALRHSLFEKDSILNVKNPLGSAITLSLV